ncbi:MAG: hypothetical protein GTN39_05570 [Candidatus Aenigmarchaeota archaeon]|nr:hypothetical protein [Candidatus Aenigmarchaeota archaeon]
MSEFQCKPGYCVKCCTDVKQNVLTIGDLYRQWFYRQKTGERTRFHNVFRELCNDWDLIPGTDGNVRAMPISKIPCPQLDMEEKKCSVHGVAIYLACAGFPEDWLIEMPSYGWDETASREFLDQLECFKGVTLSDERKEKTLKIRDIVDRETYLTTELLLGKVFPHSVVGHKPSKRVQRELMFRLRYISENKNELRVVRENLIRNKTLQDYEKYVMTEEDPGFSFCEEI